MATRNVVYGVMCHRSYARRGVEERSRERDEAADGVESDRPDEAITRHESESEREESPVPAETPLARVVRAPVAALRALVA